MNKTYTQSHLLFETCIHHKLLGFTTNQLMRDNLGYQFIKIIQEDTWMMEILKILKNLKLNDCWVGAGFVRNKIWDHQHKISRTKLNDIDVIYYDATICSKESDISIEQALKLIRPDVSWSVKNQGRMHIRNGHSPYKDCYEAISFWPETATAIAIRLSAENLIEYIAPYGLEDLFNLYVVPTPSFDLTVFNNRIKTKNWKQRWSKLKIHAQ